MRSKTSATRFESKRSFVVHRTIRDPWESVTSQRAGARIQISRCLQSLFLFRPTRNTDRPSKRPRARRTISLIRRRSRSQIRTRPRDFSEAPGSIGSINSKRSYPAKAKSGACAHANLCDCRLSRLILCREKLAFRRNSARIGSFYHLLSSLPARFERTQLVFLSYLFCFEVFLDLNASTCIRG
jgi:hypothetical protein